jgi:hypothetical protein
MELDQWRDEDFVKMKEIERELIDWLLPRVQRVSPLMALFVLIRCARVMLRKGDEDAQRAVLPTIHAYLDGHTSPPGSGSTLWTGGKVN